MLGIRIEMHPQVLAGCTAQADLAVFFPHVGQVLRAEIGGHLLFHYKVGERPAKRILQPESRKRLPCRIEKTDVAVLVELEKDLVHAVHERAQAVFAVLQQLAGLFEITDVVPHGGRAVGKRMVQFLQLAAPGFNQRHLRGPVSARHLTGYLGQGLERRSEAAEQRIGQCQGCSQHCRQEQDAAEQQFVGPLIECTVRQYELQRQAGLPGQSKGYGDGALAADAGQKAGEIIRGAWQGSLLVKDFSIAGNDPGGGNLGCAGQSAQNLVDSGGIMFFGELAQRTCLDHCQSASGPCLCLCLESSEACAEIGQDNERTERDQYRKRQCQPCTERCRKTPATGAEKKRQEQAVVKTAFRQGLAAGSGIWSFGHGFEVYMNCPRVQPSHAGTNMRSPALPARRKEQP